jgi:hypothetical protein
MHWHGQFDLVTNAGTSEHVVNQAADLTEQWQVFRTMHDLAKEHAVLMHVIPMPGGWHGGCTYTYEPDWLVRLATVCGYRIEAIYDSASDARHRAGLLIKDERSKFPTLAEFRAIGGIVTWAGATV